MKRLTIGLAGALVVAAAGCGGSSSSTPSGNQAQTSPAAQTPNPAQAAQSALQGLQAMNQNPNQNATPVDFEKLIDLLPDAPSGWTKGKPKGQQFSMGVAYTIAQVDYEKGDAAIHLEITDTSFNQLMLTPLSMFMAAGYNERSSDGYKKAAAIGGAPGFETWDNPSKNAEVTIVVANRVIVQAKGRGVDNADPVRALVASADQSKLAALK